MSVQFKLNTTKYNNISYSENISFQGLNRCLSKHFINKETALELANMYPNSRRFVGKLPHEWIIEIPEEKRKETIQEIQDLFASFAEKLYTPKFSEFPKNEKFVTDFLKKLKKFLGMDTKIEFIGEGITAGKAHKLVVGDKQYVLKTFHSDIDEELVEKHGKIMEPSRAPYAKKKGAGSFVDFYFGKTGTAESADGFMVTKFEVLDKILTPREEMKRLLRLLKSPVESSDVLISLVSEVQDSLNTIGLKIIDFGALKLLPQELHKAAKNAAKNIGEYYFNPGKNSDTKRLALDEISKLQIAASANTYSRVSFLASTLPDTLTRIERLLNPKKHISIN